MNVKVHVRHYSKEDSSTLGFATVNFGDKITLNDVRIVDGAKGAFVSMPSYPTKDGGYKDICYPVTKEFRQNLYNAIMNAYQTGKEQSFDMGGGDPQIKPIVTPFTRAGSNIRGIASVIIDESFKIGNISVMSNGKGYMFCNMPTVKAPDKDGKDTYREIVSVSDESFKKLMNDAIVKELRASTKEKLAEAKEAAASSAPSGATIAVTEPER